MSWSFFHIHHMFKASSWTSMETFNATALEAQFMLHVSQLEVNILKLKLVASWSSKSHNLSRKCWHAMAPFTMKMGAICRETKSIHQSSQFILETSLRELSEWVFECERYWVYLGFGFEKFSTNFVSEILSLSLRVNVG